MKITEALNAIHTSAEIGKENIQFHTAESQRQYISAKAQYIQFNRYDGTLSPEVVRNEMIKLGAAVLLYLTEFDDV